ncbi:hypothetical protein ABZ914_06900 [Spirillospora sp. NPDC046719]
MRRNLTVAAAAVAAAAALAALPASAHATAHAAAYPYFLCDQVLYNGGVIATGCKPKPTGNYSRLTIQEWGSPTHFLCDNGRTTGDGMLISDKCSVF